MRDSVKLAVDILAHRIHGLASDLIGVAVGQATPDVERIEALSRSLALILAASQDAPDEA